MRGLRLGLGLNTLKGAGFSPSALDNLALWFDADDSNTIVSSGGKVSQWDDKSVNGYDVTQTTGVDQPSTGTKTLNGKNVIAFGASEYINRTSIQMSNFFNATGSTIFFVERFISGIVPFQLQSAGSNRIGFEGGNRIDFPNDSSSKLIGSSTTNTWTINVGRRTSTYVKLYYNGVEEASATNGDTLTSATSVVAIGSADGGGADAVVDVAEIIIYARALSGDEINRVGAYLGKKWGLTWTDV